MDQPEKGDAELAAAVVEGLSAWQLYDQAIWHSPAHGMMGVRLLFQYTHETTWRVKGPVNWPAYMQHEHIAYEHELQRV